MDIARPSGVVFSDSLGLELLETGVAERFALEEVYVKGLAEDFPMRVHYLADRTAIADTYKRPLQRTRTHAEAEQTRTVAELTSLGNFRFELSEEPIDRGEIKLVIRHPDATRSGAKRKGISGEMATPTAYAKDSRGPHVRVNLPAIAAALGARGVKRTWECKLRIEYAVVAE